jgi:hypothetical protein
LAEIRIEQKRRGLSLLWLFIALVIVAVLELSRRRVGEPDQLGGFDDSELEALFRDGR